MSFFKHNVGRRLLAVALVGVLSALIPAFASAKQVAHKTAKKTTQKSSQPTLQYGQRGSSVKTLQSDLTAVNYHTKVTGKFDSQTKTEVKKFQKAKHLDADGVVGSQTWASLNKAMKQAQAGGPQSSTANATELTADNSGGAGMEGLPTNPSPNVGPAQTGKAQLSNGQATAPSGAPQVIQEVIQAANKIATTPYTWGGGHNPTFSGPGYDCSGSVSYALHGGGLLKAPLDSTSLESYGDKGPGQWITIYANSQHTFMTIAGLTFDTVNQSSSNGGNRWSLKPSSWETNQINSGSFTVVHPHGW
ncbi:MAG: peptidoglycan-binding protein [Solirubrobacterales bacterium]|nr:peptidoglycan-binding protein [Solirubrobacterales bacterium]